MKKKFKEVIIEASKEFDEKKGHVTCEFSINRNKIPELEKFVRENVEMKLGNWALFECYSCQEEHGVDFVHLTIQESEHISEITNSHNLIKILKNKNE